jgi:hypothetical protein
LDAAAQRLVADSTQSKTPSLTENFNYAYCANQKPRLNEAKTFFFTHVPTASNLAEYLPKIRSLFYQLASFCECEGHSLPWRPPKGSDILRASNPSTHLWAALGNQGGLRRKINLDLAKKIAKPIEPSHKTESRQYLGYVYILSCVSRDLVKVGFTNDHPYKRLSEISPCYPDAVLVAYTVPIPYPHRVEQLAHAELALQRLNHSCPACCKTHREWFKMTQGLAERVVLRWAKWIAKQPYEMHSGVLHPAWVRALDKKLIARLRPAAEDRSAHEPDWGTWTAFRASTGRKDFSAQVDPNICKEKTSPLV